MEPLQINKGHLANEHVDDAARLVVAGFEQKVAALTDDPTVAFETVREAFVIERGFFAFPGDTLIGVAGVDTQESRAVGHHPRCCRYQSERHSR